MVGHPIEPDQVTRKLSSAIMARTLGILSGIMDLMVDGLSPWVKNRRGPYGLIVVGADPAGLSAAIYAAREGVKTLIIERDRVGGIRSVIECTDNCPGVPGDLEDGERSDQTRVQPKRFEVDILSGRTVTDIRAEGDYKVVCTDKGEEYRAREVLVAPGIRDRRLDVSGEKDLTGTDLHVCASD